MSKHTIEGFITYNKFEWNDAAVISFCTWNPSEDEETAIVGKHSFEVEVPDDFNPIPQQVAALEEKKRLARIKLAEELAELDEKMSKLLCLENTGAEA